MTTPAMIQAFAFLGLGFLTLAGPAQDWPQFLGPNGDGSAPAAGTDFDWSEKAPSTIWTCATGPGYGGVAVRDGEVFFLDRETAEGDVLVILDLETGIEKWRAAYEAPGRLSFPGSRTVPTVTKNYVYTTGGHGQVACFDRVQQELTWLVNMEEFFGGNQPKYGWSAAPLIVGDILIATPLGDEVGLVGLNRFTGETVWTTAAVGDSHSTPRLLNLLGQSQVLFVSTGTGRRKGTVTKVVISSFDPKNGAPIWNMEIPGTRLPIPGIMQVSDDRFFLTGGYRGGSSMVRIQRDKDEHSFEVLFHIERGSQVHHPLVHDDHLYILVNENWNNARRMRSEGGLMCLSLDGEERWRTADAPFFGRGNALLAGNHILLQDGFDGTLRVAQAAPDGYKQIASANIFGINDRRDHKMWAPMALSGRRLLMRSQDELLCVEL